jgi:hypothetical protein
MMLGGTLRAGAGGFARRVGADSCCRRRRLAGGLFFNTGASASLLGAINAPRSVDAEGSPAVERWRWWSCEPERIDWLSTFVLFAGTLAFAVRPLRGPTILSDHPIWVIVVPHARPTLGLSARRATSHQEPRSVT